MNIVQNKVRGIDVRLVGYTRALELCARMNRETEVLDFIDEMQAGSVLYDLGACEGRFAIYAALRGIRCYAFEPEALNFQALVENRELNGKMVGRLLMPLKYAVGERTHRSRIRIGQPWAGGHHRVLAGVERVDLNFEFTADQEVEVVSLDEFMTERGLPAPDYLKVDVDGSELSFIKGAVLTLRSKILKGVMFELQSQDESYDQIMSFMASCNFVPFMRFEVEPSLFNIWFKRPNAQ